MSEWITDFIDAAATLIAVILGSVLTIITSSLAEQQQQKHRKKEQIREQQMQAVKNIVQTMQNIEIIIDSVAVLCNIIFNNNLQNLTHAQQVNKIKNAKTQTKDCTELILKNKRELLQNFWELKYLKYGTSQLNIINDFQKILEEFLQLINEDSFFNEDDKKTLAEKKIKHINDLFNKFVDEARNGLS